MPTHLRYNYRFDSPRSEKSWNKKFALYEKQRHNIKHCNVFIEDLLTSIRSQSMILKHHAQDISQSKIRPCCCVIKDV